jgi:hypothetical protein
MVEAVCSGEDLPGSDGDTYSRKQCSLIETQHAVLATPLSRVDGTRPQFEGRSTGT